MNANALPTERSRSPKPANTAQQHQQKQQEEQQQPDQQQVHHGQGSLASQGQPPGISGDLLMRRSASGSAGSDQEETSAKRQGRMGSQEQDAQTASVRLHEAIELCKVSHERLVAHKKAHHREVEAHLAERARLIKQLEALEEDEDAAQLSMPHIRSLYDEYAAIIGQL